MRYMCNNLSVFLSLALLSLLFLTGCGGGGGDDASSIGNNTNNITTAEYSGSVEIPNGADLDIASLKIYSGLSDGVNPSSDGAFQLKMNTDATGLITVKDASENLVMFVAFPKHADLKNKSPILSTKNAAISMVFMQPGIIVSDPVLAAVLMKIIETLPETQTLTNLITSKMQLDSYILSHPDQEIINALSNATNALLKLAEQNKKAKKLLLATDTNTSAFYDADGKDGDRVAVEVSNIETINLPVFHLTNTKSRWVFFYLDHNQSGQPAFDSSYPAGLVDPAKFELPNLSDLILDGLVNNLGGVIWDIFDAEDDNFLQNIIDRAKETVANYYGDSEADFTVDLTDYRDSFLSSYALGKFTEYKNTNFRTIAPTLLTGVTEIILPGLCLGLDLRAESVFKVESASAVQLLVQLSERYVIDVEAIIAEYASGEKADAFYDFLKLLEHLSIDQDFLEWMVKNGLLSKDNLSKMMVDLFGSVLKIVTPLGWIDTGIDFANLAIGGIKILDYITTEDEFDLYRISLPVSSPPDTTAPSVPMSLTATELSSSQINLSWTASTDNVGVSGYKVYRNGTYLKSVTGTFTSDTGLSPSTQYCYTVSAYDTANNESAQSSQACATTLVSGTIPSPPLGVSATPGNGQIMISWTAISGATSYNIYMASVSGVTKSNYGALPDGIKHTGVVSPFTIAGLTNGKTYYFVVTAVNAYGESAESTEVSEVAGGLIYASSGEGTGSGPSSLYKSVPTIDGNDMLVGLITTPDGLNPVITDLALTPTGILYGVSFDTLYIIDKTTAIATPVGSGLGFTDVNALASDSIGNLFASGFVEPSFLLGVSISTGLATTIGPYGTGFISSGDLVFSPNGILYATVLDPNITNTVLVTVDQNSGIANRVNSINDSGFTNIWGLSFVGGQLYGLTSDINGIGILLLIDINTGQGSFVRNINFSAFGSSKPRK